MTPKYQQVSPISPYLHVLPVPSPTAPQPPKLSNRSYNLPSDFGSRPPSIQSLSLGHSPEDDEVVKKNLQPILAMIEPKSPLDIQLEGIRILCDLTMTIDFHRLLVESNCVEKLIDLLTMNSTIADHGELLKDQVLNEETCCHQYALYAIANMSTFRPCQVISLVCSPS